MEDSIDTPTPHLLTLPAEIRNQIWRIVLLEPGDIPIGPRISPPSQPGILQTNRQLRQECAEIYYQENRLAWNLLDFDATELIKWTQSSKWRLNARLTLSHEIHSRNLWENIRYWVKAAYHGETPRPRTDEKIAHPALVCFEQFFKIAWSLGRLEQSFDIVEEHLESMHVAIVTAGGFGGLMDWMQR